MGPRAQSARRRTTSVAATLMIALVGCGPGPAGPRPTPLSGDALGCNPTTGLRAPLPACSSSNPCMRPASELSVAAIDTPSDPPRCRTTHPGRPVFDDSPPQVSTDASGVPRYACLFRPAGASAASPRPLIVFLHGGGIGSADTVYDDTSLRWKAEGYDLSGDRGRDGFFLLSIQGGNLHYPTAAPRDGHHHDFYFRDLRSPSTNPDMVHLDRLIDSLVAEGSVDRRRIYLMGWSNGGFFGQMYAIARHASPTPGGNRVAAAVPFTAADPFHDVNPAQFPSCQLDPYPRSTVPLFVVSRSCDRVACDEAQAAAFVAGGTSVEPGHVVEPWIRDLALRVGNPNVSRRIVSGMGRAVRDCTPAALCSPAIGLLNHVRWPDGVADGSGIDHEPDMLDFLRLHPLP